MNKPLAYRELRRILVRYGVIEHKGRGKGSHRILERWVQGRRFWYTVTVHKESQVFEASVIKATRRRLLLDPEHGISDEEFYG